VKAVQCREQRDNEVMNRQQTAFKKHVEYVMASGLDWEKTPPPDETKFTKEEFQEMQRLEFEIQLFTECFYYLAGRLRTILRNRAEPFPGLTSFECEGVRNVRNWLLEHSEREHSRVTIRSLGWGGPQGPVLKSIREQGQEQVFPDKGLYCNAAEIKANLERLISNALA
jgi:hypothetical protein